jgi:hypothetical protein
MGEIKEIPHTFAVTWRIESPASVDGYEEVVQEGMTPLIDVQDAWQRLHNPVPRLVEKGNIAFRGKLRPGQTIQVEVQREEIEVAVRFEHAHKGTITFTQERLSIMSPRSEVHTRFAREDLRIPPYACYEHEDVRQYYDNTLPIFHLEKGIDIPDTLGNGGGSGGGNERKREEEGSGSAERNAGTER